MDRQFETLARLKNTLAAFGVNHVATMNYYASGDKAGFWHQPAKREKASLSSTATCVSSLVRANKWLDKGRVWGSSKAIVQRLLRKPWTGADLPKNNPFSLSFIAEGVLDAIGAEEFPGADRLRKRVLDEIVPLLIDSLDNSTATLAVKGAVSIDPYPPSAYLTQLAFRVLRRCHELAPKLIDEISDWARSELNRQVALILMGSRIADPMQLAYALIVSADSVDDERTPPEDKALRRQALSIFFDSQLPDGTWPPSQPLFHYPEVGNAQCFDYELLTQLLNCRPLQDELLLYLPKLELATAHLDHTSYALGKSTPGVAVAWASGHHPQIGGPESWSTACVYDFVHSLDRLVAEAIRRSLFVELGARYTPPLQKDAPVFAERFLDAELSVEGQMESLRDNLRDRFVLPIAGRIKDIATGGKLPKLVPMSAILFGPPGTSKTQLASLIAEFLGWPLLSVDPSYLVQDGMEQLYARANHLFSMLAMAEQTVVLLDEFDEMGKNRVGSADMLSRLMAIM